MVWECDTDLDGLKPYEEPDKGDNRVEVSDEEEGDQEGVNDKNKPSGKNLKGPVSSVPTHGFSLNFTY